MNDTSPHIELLRGCEFDGESGVFVEQLVVLKAAVELSEHAIEEILLGRRMPVPMVVTAPAIVAFGAG